MNTNIDEWRTIRGAQCVVPWSRATYYNAIARGDIKSRRSNGARLICIASLIDFVEKSDEKPPKAITRRMRRLGRLSAKKRAQIAAAKNGAAMK
jgi:hypothetical protein